jgi:hypothetical protein
VSRARNHIYMKTKIKEERTGGEKREKRYDWIVIYFEETMHWECIFLCDIASIETTSSVLGWDRA